MDRIEASAPGKALISGEYAVLSGAPALSMALDRRACVSLEPATGAHHTIAAPGYWDDRLGFRAVPGGKIEWLDPLPAPDAFRLFECVWQSSGVELDTALSVTLDTREFFEPAGGEKLGLGSSSALAVATVAALDLLLGRVDSSCAAANSAHRAFQGGKGSGVDIATAFHGGFIQFQLGRPSVALRWPDGLDYRFFWSGQSARTADKLNELDARSAAGDDAALIAASEWVLRKMQEGSAIEIVAGMRAYVEALVAFDHERSLGIFAAGHEQLVNCARTRADIVYKPCGAGGGDIGVALAASSDVLEEFAMVAKQHDFVELDARFERQGVLAEVR